MEIYYVRAKYIYTSRTDTIIMQEEIVFLLCMNVMGEITIVI